MYNRPHHSGIHYEAFRHEILRYIARWGYKTMFTLGTDDRADRCVYEIEVTLKYFSMIHGSYTL